jgi:hypothetical protein
MTMGWGAVSVSFTQAIFFVAQINRAALARHHPLQAWLGELVSSAYSGGVVVQGNSRRAWFHHGTRHSIPTHPQPLTSTAFPTVSQICMT